MDTKQCIMCKQIKEITEFVKRNTSKSGYGNLCKPCESKRTTEWGKKNRDKRNLYNRRYDRRYPFTSWAIRVLASHKKNGYEVRISTKELRLIAEHSLNCNICGSELNWFKDKERVYETTPSLDRVNNENHIDKDNLMIVCHSCNTTKGPRSLKDFVSYCLKIAGRFAGVDFDNYISVCNLMRETDSKEQIRENAERPYALSDERKIGIAKLKEFYAQEKKCLYCGEKFTPKAKNSTYCSHNCQKSDWRKRQLSDVIEKKQCVWCGKEFIPSRNDSMYCSQHCNAAAFRDRKRI